MTNNDPVDSLSHLYYSHLALHMHVIVGQLTEERLNRHTHLRTDGPVSRNLSPCQHTSRDSKWYSGIQCACAHAPTTIGQDHNLIGDLYLLSASLASRDDTQYIAIL